MFRRLRNIWWLTTNIWNINPDYARPHVKLRCRVSAFWIRTMRQALLNILRIFTFCFYLRMPMLTRTCLDKCKSTILPLFVSFPIAFVFQNTESSFSVITASNYCNTTVAWESKPVLLNRLKFFLLPVQCMYETGSSQFWNNWVKKSPKNW